MKGRESNYRLAALGAIGVLVATCTVWAQPSEAPTLADGFFSAAQVARGEQSFAWSCTDCHEVEEFTGVGAYLEEMEGETLWEVFEFVWLEMPEDQPSWLEPEEYADILAYILSVYGHPTGESDMPVDETILKSVTITAPERPGS